MQDFVFPRNQPIVEKRKNNKQRMDAMVFTKHPTGSQSPLLTNYFHSFDDLNVKDNIVPFITKRELTLLPAINRVKPNDVAQSLPYALAF